MFPIAVQHPHLRHGAVSVTGVATTILAVDTTVLAIDETHPHQQSDKGTLLFFGETVDDKGISKTVDPFNRCSHHDESRETYSTYSGSQAHFSYVMPTTGSFVCVVDRSGSPRPITCARATVFLTYLSYKITRTARETLTMYFVYSREETYLHHAYCGVK